MGVKAVWGICLEPVVCFSSGGGDPLKPHRFYGKARAAAEKSVGSPFLFMIGGGKGVPAPLRGRVLDLVRLTCAYGQTTAFITDPDLRENLAQWPVAVALGDVYEIVGSPGLVENLGFPGRKILSSVYDGVNYVRQDTTALWNALADWTVRRRHVPSIPGFVAPKALQLCPTLPPQISRSEGARRVSQARSLERSGPLRDAVKQRNRDTNGGRLVCEACGWADDNPGMFDAHHVCPLWVGERESNIEDFAVLCPTCHRWAHRKGGGSMAEPLNIHTLRKQRSGR